MVSPVVSSTTTTTFMVIVADAGVVFLFIRKLLQKLPYFFITNAVSSYQIAIRIPTTLWLIPKAYFGASDFNNLRR